MSDYPTCPICTAALDEGEHGFGCTYLDELRADHAWEMAREGWLERERRAMTDPRTPAQYAAAQIVVVAMQEPIEVAEPLYAIAARLIAPIETTGADAMPHADVIELESRRS